MSTFIKAGFWEKLCKPCKGYKGWLNLDEFVTNIVTALLPQPNYKVFTALLTQSEGNGIGTVYVGTDYGPNQLTIGITYTIAGNDTTDFANVGAPNNEVGTSFIATGTNPNNQNANGQTYLDYNTGAPVATVLENTIGNIWFEYIQGQPGTYVIGSDLPYPGLYGPNSWGISGPAGIIGSDTKYFVTIQGSQVRVGTGDDEVFEGKLNSTPIEIRLYN